MKLKFYYLLLLIGFLCSPVFAQTPCWELMWAEEFDVNGLPNPKTWGYDVGGHGWGNNELQHYTDARLENARVEDGKLIISAIKENYNSKEWTSARLVTRAKADWLYGRIEVNAKLPAAAKGTWAAIWMLPTDWQYGGWPKSGEIDIMENVGYEPAIVHGTVHTDAFNHTKNSQKGGPISVPDNAEVFHTYTAEWFKDKIDFYVDDTKYFTFVNQNKTYSEWPFDKRFHLILNIAIGGNWGGSRGVDPNFSLAKMEVDYIRVYSNQNTMAISGPSQVIKGEPNLKFMAPTSKKFTYSWEVPSDATITGSSTDSVLNVTWGCTEGKVICHVKGDCKTYDIEHVVTLKEPVISGKRFVTANEKGVLYTADLLPNTTYTWKASNGITIASGGNTNKALVDWNDAKGNISVEIKNSCGTQTLDYEVLIKGQYPFPDYNTPHAIPGIIEAVNYDYGGEGVAYHDTDDKNEGPGVRGDEAVDTENGDANKPNVGWINSGEWLAYTVNVTKGGYYSAKIRAASEGTPDSIVVSFNDVPKYKGKIEKTNSWGTFKDFLLGEVYLEAGQHVMKLDFKKGGYNVSKITFEAPTGGDKDVFSNAKIYPNPNDGSFYLSGIQNVSSIKIIDAIGRTKSVSFTKENDRYYLNAGIMPKGLYTLKATSGTKVLVRRVIIK